MPTRTRSAKSTKSSRWSLLPFRKKPANRRKAASRVSKTNVPRLVLQLLIVVAIGGGGVYLLTNSHAATCGQKCVNDLQATAAKKAKAAHTAQLHADDLKKLKNAAKAAYDTAVSTQQAAKHKYNNKQSAVAAAQKAYDDINGKKHPKKKAAAKDTLDAAKKALSQAKSALATANDAADKAEKKFNNKKKDYTSAQNAADKAQDAADKAHKAAKNAADALAAQQAKARQAALKKAQEAAKKKAAAAKKADATAKKKAEAAKKADKAVKNAHGKKAKQQAQKAATQAHNAAKKATQQAAAADKAAAKAHQKAVAAKKALAAQKAAQKAAAKRDQAQQNYETAQKAADQAQADLENAQQLLLQAQQKGDTALAGKIQAHITQLQQKVTQTQRQATKAKQKFAKAADAATAATEATARYQRQVARATALQSKAVTAADACDLLGRKANPLSASGCEYGQDSCITGAWVPIIRNDGSKSGYCTGYINPNMTQDQCNKLGRHYVTDFGCARRANRTSKNGADQCLPGYNYIAAPHNKGADRCVQATVVEGKVKKAGAQPASGMTTAGKHNDPTTRVSCDLLGRTWDGKTCTRVCQSNAGALLMSSSKDTPANQYYCQKTTAANISQNACVNLYHRVWLGYGCARRADQKSKANAPQCQAGWYYLANSKASNNKGLDICSPTKAIALQNQKNGITGVATASPLPTVTCADGSVVDAATKKCKDGQTPTVTCASGTVLNQDTGMCDLKPGVQMLCPGGTKAKPDADTFTCGTGDNQVNVVLLIPNCPKGKALTDDGTACQGTATTPSQPTKNTVTVDTSIAKDVCVKLLGRLWMPAQKQKDGTKSPAGCSVATCQNSKNKVVANKDGTAYCKGYISKITQGSCAALHRLWVLSAGGCANSLTKGTDVNAQQCAGNYSVFVSRKGEPGQCMKPSTVQKLQKVADSVKGGTIDKVLDLGKAGFCKARGKLYTNGACVNKPKHVNHAPAPSSHEPASHSSKAPNGSSWSSFCASLGRSAAGKGCSSGCNKPSYSRDASTASAHYGYDKCVASSGGTALSQCLRGAHSDSAISGCYASYGSAQQKCLSQGGNWVDSTGGMHCVSNAPQEVSCMNYANSIAHLSDKTYTCTFRSWCPSDWGGHGVLVTDRTYKGVHYRIGAYQGTDQYLCKNGG